MKIETMSFDAICEHVRKLRLERDKSDARFLLFLVQIERVALDTVLNSGCQSFAQFVQEFVKVGRYAAFKAGVEKIGDAEALEIGSEATIEASTVPSASTEQFVEEARDWTAKNGRLPTREAARDLAIKSGAPPGKAKNHGYRDELARLQAENAELRAENRALKAKLAKLEKNPPPASSKRKRQPSAHASA